MIKTIIVDDDIEMLQGLENIITWEDYGFSLVGKADNGADALELVKTYLPELIITDITMPVMNGLILIREAKEIIPEVKTVILTCHEDFYYAKEAIELAVDDYLVKITLTEKELIRTILKIKEKIKIQKMQKDTVLQMDYELNSSKHVIKNKFFMDIAEGLSLQQNYLHKKAEFLKIDIPKDEYRVVGLFIDNFNHAIRKCPIKERNLLQYAISNILEEMIQPIKNITFFSYSDDTYIILYWDNDSNIIIKQKMMDTLKEFQEKIVEYLHISISACISSYYTNITNLKKALDEVRGLRNGYFYLGTRTIMTPQQYQFNNISESLAKKYLDDFRNAINTYDKSIINQYLKEWYEEIIKKNYEPNNVKELFKRVFIDVGALANKHGIKVDELDYDADTFETYQNNLISAVNNVLLRIEQEKNISSRKEINDVIKYIEKNIGEPINCELMANHVNMNSSYFSRLFKQEVGVSFSEYLINKRIERATDLLINTNLTIEEIAQAVGIENVSYFYRIYKKVTGKTPREIREAK